MAIDRREFLKTGAGAATFAMLPPALVRLGRRPEPAPPIEDPRLKALALGAIEAARRAGAAYADVRLTRTTGRQYTLGVRQGFSSGDDLFGSELLAAGVRALVDGYWGFASSAVWSPEELARLGREAVHQARTNALGKPRQTELAPAPPVRDGHWATPVKRDPFTVPPGEVFDFMHGVEHFVERTPGAGLSGMACHFVVQEKAFASTDGSYCTQRLYRTSGHFAVRYQEGMRQGVAVADFLSGAAAGWEYIHEAPLREAVPGLIAEVVESWTLPVKPVEVGRYDLVCDARSVAELLEGTLGRATELDRAMGYEANAGGTSYLNDPIAMLGTFQVGAPLLGVTADRTTPGGTATVRWDDEGVEADAFPLVAEGRLTDFPTTRESAGWLAEAYRRQGRSPRSHGCANSGSALDAPLLHVPNLSLAAGPNALDFDDLVAGVKHGLALTRATVDLDFQQLSGLALGRFYEIKDGKRVAHVTGAGVLFRSPELWKGLRALGGESSRRTYAFAARKGEPPQVTWHSVRAVPAAFQQVTVIDAVRRA